MADFAKMFKVGVMFDLIDKVSKPLSGVASSFDPLSRKAYRAGKALESIGDSMSKTGMKIAATGAAMAAAFVLPVKSAIEFESKMADIRKVVDFPTPQSFKQMGDDILKMTYGLQGIPMSVGELQDIVRAAGESDVAKTHEELLAFARDAAKLGVAFDVSGAQAGEIMTSWRMSMNLAQGQAMQLADAVNYLSNNMASNAADLSEILKRQGAVGVNSGLTAIQTAALASAFKSTGINTEIAATGMKNFLNALTQGEKATPKDIVAFKALGIDAVKVAKSMQTDALPTIMDVLQRIKQVEAWRQPAIISQIFGEESKGAIMPLLTNLDLLSKAFGLVGDSTKYAGSMQAEFDVRSKTTANALQLAGNAIKALAINIGSVFLPYVAEAATRVNLFVERLINWGKEHQTLSKILTLGMASVSAFLVVVGGGLAILGFFVSGIGSGIKAFIALRAAVLALTGTQALFSWATMGAAIFNPLTMAVTGAAAAGLLLYANWDKVQALGEWIVTKWQQVKAFFVGFWSEVEPSLRPLIDWFKSAWEWSSKVLDKLAGFMGLKDGLKDWPKLENPYASFVAPDLTAPSIPKMGPLAMPEIDKARLIADAANAGKMQGRAFAGHLSKTMEDVKSVWASVSNASSVAWDGIKSAGVAAGSMIDGAFKAAANAIIAAFTWIGQKWDQVIAAIKTAADGLVAKFNSVWTSITSFDLFGAGQRMIQSLINGITSKIAAVGEAVKGVASSISNYLIPHSPIPMGPLSEVHLAGYRIMDMVRQGIQSSPIADALNQALAFSMPSSALAGAGGQQSFPALSRATPRSSGGLPASPSVQVSLSYSPQITIQGDGGTGATQKLLTDNARDMEDRVYNAVRRAMQRRDRIEFGAEDIHY
jgi:TP901 family phage tail tape measure protein